MSGLLTQVVRRQALNVVARRNTSGLIVHGPPVVKLTTAERTIALFLFLGTPMLYPMYIMSNLQKYNGSNRGLSSSKKSASKK